MPKRILMDQIGVTIEAPSGLSKARLVKIRRTLRSKRFVAQLREAVQTCLLRFPSLRPVQVTIN